MWKSGKQTLTAIVVAGCSGLASAQTPRAPDQDLRLVRTERSPWIFQASGFVTHFRDPQCANCEYRSTVPGIGLQREVGPSGGSGLAYTFSGGLQNDSFGRSGGYAAAVASLPLASDSLIVRPGLGAFAFYRYMEEGGKRALIPAILPVLAIEGRRSGVGATLLVAPNFTYAGLERSGFVFLQFTFRLGRR